ncbi:unnamed protein product (macronuclear) [Paramecium tetraurelia]|uniref:Uncharacterized protein n=1 Tax=Paramecium tetraurelia TaxID=5888 RepID=A0D142_PARTE|nr:uncharacterized protein GSPATT00039174001 [Paramecium tetraurelia]CAK76759.1 unnamed protein product [Paramecium tetraurelia]|eukprot:XP_001444156.1 hypothetical protein (macronuclear) [Paramecium tetraurelia strain d4-2]
MLLLWQCEIPLYFPCSTSCQALLLTCYFLSPNYYCLQRTSVYIIKLFIVTIGQRGNLSLIIRSNRRLITIGCLNVLDLGTIQKHSFQQVIKQGVSKPDLKWNIIYSKIVPNKHQIEISIDMHPNIWNSLQGSENSFGKFDGILSECSICPIVNSESQNTRTYNLIILESKTVKGNDCLNRRIKSFKMLENQQGNNFQLIVLIQICLQNFKF